MREHYAKIFGLMIAAALLSSMLAVNTTRAQPADSMWITPASVSYTTNTLPAGNLFNITVYLNVTSANVFGYQVSLLYNTAQLNCTAADFTDDFMDSPPKGLVQAMDISTAGLILAFESCKAPDKIVVPKSGSLIWATFEIIALPGKGETLSSTLDISTGQASGKTWVQDPTGAIYIIGVGVGTVYDAAYSLLWMAPSTVPHFAISPTSQTFGPFPPSAVGTTFVEIVSIVNLDASWGLTNASFTLTFTQAVIDILGAPGANVTINTVAFNGANVVGYAAGVLSVTVFTTNTLGGAPVLVATITFTVMDQNVYPAPALTSALTFGGELFYDHTLLIGHDPSVNGLVTILSLMSIPRPWIEVSPPTQTFGPNPVVGTTFNVNVLGCNLSANWYAVGFQFRLLYNSTNIHPVVVTEGPFWTDPTWDLHGTFFWSTWEYDPMYGDNVIVADILLPDNHGDYDQAVFPNDMGAKRTLATITFMIDYQRCPYNYTSYLDLVGFWTDDLEAFIDRDGVYIPGFPTVNGTYTVLGNYPATGRVLDLYGGAKNDGYWSGYPLPFTPPYGGQGVNGFAANPLNYTQYKYNMDLVFPQSEITLYVNLTYNWWPVQTKDVGFEIEGPYFKNTQSGLLYNTSTYQILAKLVATTDANGIAKLTFRMPWPCDNPDGITGLWKITATATVADQVVGDTMLFYYERVVYMTKVTTDIYSYIHGDTVVVTVDWETHSQQMYPALFSVVITDDLGVPVGMALKTVTVGGAVFCTWKTGEFTVSIVIPKWAYAGYGYVHVNVYDKDPTVGGEAYDPEYRDNPPITYPSGHVSAIPEIQINPY